MVQLVDEFPQLLIFVVLSSLVLTALLIPAIRRAGAQLGFIDWPLRRKVHTRPVPRVGGAAIVTASVASCAIWLPLDATAYAYLGGVLVLFPFGLWDDRAGLGPWPKLLGQVAAASVYVGLDPSAMNRLPLFDVPLPGALVALLTVIYLTASANAVNFVDGLDGLAGGISLMSLALVGILAHTAGETGLVVLAALLCGAVFGFLQFNRHPARIFMGDSGSQFLGFSIAVMLIELLEKSEPELSPVLLLALMGWPFFDMAVAVSTRLLDGRSLFQADASHPHYRLLRLGLSPIGAVWVVYMGHGALLLTAAALRYADDRIVLSACVLACVAFLAVYSVLAALRSRVRRMALHPDDTPTLGDLSPPLKERVALAALWVATTCLPVTIITAALFAQPAPSAVAFGALALCAAIVLTGLVSARSSDVPERMSVLGGFVLLVVLVGETERMTLLSAALLHTLLLTLAVAVLLRLATCGYAGPRIWPLDLVAVLGLLLVAGHSGHGALADIAGWMPAALIVLVYSSRVVAPMHGAGWGPLRHVTAGALAIVAFRAGIFTGG